MSSLWFNATHSLSFLMGRPTPISWCIEMRNGWTQLMSLLCLSLFIFSLHPCVPFCFPFQVVRRMNRSDAARSGLFLLTEQKLFLLLVILIVKSSSIWFLPPYPSPHHPRWFSSSQTHFLSSLIDFLSLFSYSWWFSVLMADCPLSGGRGEEEGSFLSHRDCHRDERPFLWLSHCACYSSFIVSLFLFDFHFRFLFFSLHYPISSIPPERQGGEGRARERERKGNVGRRTKEKKRKQTATNRHTIALSFSSLLANSLIAEKNEVRIKRGRQRAKGQKYQYHGNRVMTQNGRRTERGKQREGEKRANETEVEGREWTSKTVWNCHKNHEVRMSLQRKKQTDDEGKKWGIIIAKYE